MTAGPLSLLTVVIPAFNEADCITSTVSHLSVELRIHQVPHQIVIVDDHSTDRTWDRLEELRQSIPEVEVIQNSGPRGYGRAVSVGVDRMKGDALVVMMADESDDCRDVVRYWTELNKGYDCVFGSRFIKGGGTVDYPRLKLILNRLINYLLRLFFRIKLNDVTNAFKAYRRETIDGCRPLISPHFNLTVELPLKAIVRGFSWHVVPVTWRNRRAGESHLDLREMGSRYLFICLYVWLEKYFSRGDYKRR